MKLDELEFESPSSDSWRDAPVQVFPSGPGVDGDDESTETDEFDDR